MFSESFNLELSDIHIILGPSKDHMTKDGLFKDARGCSYDLNDDLSNLEKKQKIVDEFRRPFIEEEKRQRREEKQKRRDERQKQRQQIMKK